MHHIEPFYNWRDRYIADQDKLSPFYGRKYNEFEYDQMIYNYYIHPQWDNIDSQGLFVKLLFADYDDQFAIIELFGEWNDAIDNDIMLLRQELIDPLMEEGINQFILIGENVLNFHGSDDSYYEDLQEKLQDENGWIIGINFNNHVVDEMRQYGITNFIQLEPPFDSVKWRPYKPEDIYQNIDNLFSNWLEDGLLKLS